MITIEPTETVKIPSGLPPSTVSGQETYILIKSLRTLIRDLSIPPLQDSAVDAAFAELEDLISKRASKESRLVAVNQVRQVIQAQNKNRQARLEQVKQLAQKLPTVPNLPKSESDNIVRAIVAILRSNGVTMHDWGGN